MSAILIRNGRILDPASGRDEKADLLAEDGKVAAVGPGIDPERAETVIEAEGLLVTPGLVDLHCHLREPGREDSENIASGTRAAAAGGFTSICPMPNTTPPVDDAQGLQFLRARARDTGAVNLFPIACVTEGQKGEAIVEFGDLVYYGAVAFSDDGHPIMNNEIMRRALEYTSMFDVPILDHCEDLDLSENGLIRDGEWATRLGLKGIPYPAESIQVARDIDLAHYTGGRVHICHTSVRRSIEYIREAKAEGIRITCEATPHHLTLCDEKLAGYESRYQMSPPLGTAKDRRGLIEGLKDGSIDAIATDHAPHTDMEKDNVINQSAYGVIGFETAFAVLHTELVAGGEIPLPLLIEKMTIAPSRILKLDKGTLAVGADADIAVFNLDEKWTVDTIRFQSRSHNCPWAGEQLQGRAVATVVGGRLVWREGEILV